MVGDHVCFNISPVMKTDRWRDIMWWVYSWCMLTSSKLDTHNDVWCNNCTHLPEFTDDELEQMGFWEPLSHETLDV